MRSVVLLSAVVLLLCSSALATPQVVAAYWPTEGGYRLDFTIEAGEYEVYEWGVMRTDPFDLAAAHGWYARLFTRYTYWMASSTQDLLQPGQTLVGCAASLPELPQRIDYYVMQMGVGDAYRGTLTPIPAPEPSSLLALLAGVAGVAASLRRAKR